MVPTSCGAETMGKCVIGHGPLKLWTCGEGEKERERAVAVSCHGLMSSEPLRVASGAGYTVEIRPLSEFSIPSI